MSSRDDKLVYAICLGICILFFAGFAPLVLAAEEVSRTFTLSWENEPPTEGKAAPEFFCARYSNTSGSYEDGVPELCSEDVVTTLEWAMTIDPALSHYFVVRGELADGRVSTWSAEAVGASYPEGEEPVSGPVTITIE